MPYGHPSQPDPRLNGNTETGVIRTSAFAYTNVLLASNDLDTDGAGNPWTFNGVTSVTGFWDSPQAMGGYKNFGIGGGAATDNIEQIVSLAHQVDTQPVAVSIYAFVSPLGVNSNQCKLEAVFTDTGSGDELTYALTVDPASGQIVAEDYTANFTPTPNPSNITKSVQAFPEGLVTCFRINFALLTSEIPGADQITFRFYPDVSGANNQVLAACAQIAIAPTESVDGGPGTSLDYDTALWDFPAYLPTYDIGERSFPSKAPFSSTDQALPIVDTDAFGVAEYFIDLYKDEGRLVQTSLGGTFVLPGNDEQADKIERGWACFLSGNEDVFTLRLTNNSSHLQVLGGGFFTGPTTVEIPGDVASYIYRLVLIDPDNITWLLIPWTPPQINPNFMEFFDSSGSPYSFDWPVGVSRINVIAVAAGGGGGGSSTVTDQPGGGGGGGECLQEYIISATPGTTLTIVVGAGGAAGTDGNPPTDGDDGGDTSVSGSFSDFTLEGGKGGIAGDAAPGEGGAGGFVNGFYNGQAGQSAILGLDGGASNIGVGGRIFDLTNGFFSAAVKGGGGPGAPGAITYGFGADFGADGYVLFTW